MPIKKKLKKATRTPTAKKRVAKKTKRKSSI